MTLSRMLFQLPHARLAARSWLILILIAAGCAGLCTGLCAEKPKDLRPQGYVNDFAGVLSGAAREKLAALCLELDQKAGAQIAIVTVKSLDGDTVEDFTIQLATQWGVGPKEKSRGVMILLSPGDHKYRIEVGYGLEPILPDGKVGSFGREAVPLLRANDYDGAVLQMTQRVAAVIAEDKGITLSALGDAPSSSVPPERDRGSHNLSQFLHYIYLAAFVVFLLRGVFSLLFSSRGNGSRRGRGSGWWIGPMIGGGGSWGGGNSGGGGFGGGGSGGGFGGFGGGSFGGGGASGSW